MRAWSETIVAASKRCHHGSNRVNCPVARGTHGAHMPMAFVDERMPPLFLMTGHETDEPAARFERDQRPVLVDLQLDSRRIALLGVKALERRNLRLHR
jgi:hypothetical protein